MSQHADISVGALIAIVFVIGKLIVEAVKKAQAPPSSPPRGGAMRQKEKTGNDSTEEERTRKFLEALGLPGDSLAAHPKPEVMRPSTPRETFRGGNIKPVPPIVARGWPAQPPSLPRPAQAEIEARRLEKKRRKAEEHRHREQQEQPYDGAIERVHFAELKTPPVPEFHTRSSDVAAIPFEAVNSVAGQVYRREESAVIRELVALARSPKAMRQAILLREILGPPRGLQSLSAATTLNAL